MIDQLSIISKNIEDKKLSYSSSKGQDCSGIFHQIKDSLKTKNQEIIDNGSFIFPQKNKYRSSKQIALWYYQQDNFTIIKNPLKHTDKIIPGAVVFFGYSGKKYKPSTIEELTSSKKGAINHVAIVTSVKRDSLGELEEYTMMHAHNKKRPASRTTSKKVQSQYRELTPFGNWNQQLIGISHIISSTKNED